MTLLAEDLRCLDAHAHLGNFVFDHFPGKAIRHYEVGVRIGEFSLGEGFNGVLAVGAHRQPSIPSVYAWLRPMSVAPWPAPRGRGGLYSYALAQSY